MIHLSFTQDVGGFNLGVVGIVCFEEVDFLQLLTKGIKPTWQLLSRTAKRRRKRDGSEEQNSVTKGVDWTLE